MTRRPTDTDMLAEPRRAAESAAESEPVNWLARAGLTARGVTYILIGVLALLLALGASGKHADQKGAMTELLSHSYGSVLVGALAVGFFGYAVWRLLEAAFGVTGEPNSATARLKSAGRGVIYLGLMLTAVNALRGSSQSQSGQQETFTSRALAHTGGRFLVIAVGLAVVAVAAVMIVEGWKLKFMRFFQHIPPHVGRLVVHLGRIGTIGRGCVFAVAGLLVVIAGWRLDPQYAGGMDAAFRTVLGQPYGRVLGVIAALALAAFGVYGLAEARWRRV